MISFIRGMLVQKKPTAVIIECNGLGYEVLIPVSTFETLEETDRTVQLHTYLHVREDILRLYGFRTVRERRLFRLLISVSGIGPNLALSVLSGSTVGEFERAVRQGDTRAITGIPGIGKKTAERMVVELREKIGVPDGTHEKAMPEEERGPVSADDVMINDALGALAALGLKSQSARTAVEKVVRQQGAPDSVEELIRKALKHA